MSARLSNLVLGIWLFLAPWVFGADRPSDHVLGVLIAVTALVGTRVPGVRYANAVLGLCVALLAILERPFGLAETNAVVVGFGVCAFALIATARRQRPATGA